MIAPKGKKTGRKTKCTPEFIEQFALTVEKVYYLRTAAKGFGLHFDTVERWMSEGEKHLRTHLNEYKEVEECNDTCDENLVAFRTFLISVKVAQSKFTQSNLNELHKHKVKSWQAAAWLLERMQPEDYAMTQRIEQKNTNINIDSSKLLDMGQRQKALNAAREALAIETTQDEDGIFIPVQSE